MSATPCNQNPPGSAFHHSKDQDTPPSYQSSRHSLLSGYWLCSSQEPVQYHQSENKNLKHEWEINLVAYLVVARITLENVLRCYEPVPDKQTCKFTMKRCSVWSWVSWRLLCIETFDNVCMEHRNSKLPCLTNCQEWKWAGDSFFGSLRFFAFDLNKQMKE